jgi:hypothetical protein
MYKIPIRILVLASIVCLVGCSPGGGTATPSTSTPASTGAGPPTATSPPFSSSSATAPPGAGDANLVIRIKPSESEPAIIYTLVCKDGVPTTESEHPSAAKACTELKNNPSALRRGPRGTNQECTLQYGGPQEATVTGTVDGSPVDTSFSRRDGCEIGRWNEVQNILGSSGAF